MSLNQLHKQLKEKNIKFLFTDYYDTIVHRHVHPNYVQRIWAKLMIQELGFETSIDNLYFIRQESSKYLVEQLEKEDFEIPYTTLQHDICKRLINADIISIEEKDSFLNLFEEADVRAEASVQYLNQDVIDTIKYFKSNGGKVYLVSDFYGSKTLFEKLLKHHGIIDLFEDIYSSAALEKSKHTGDIYESVLKELAINPHEVMMIGDNHRSDYLNATKSGLNAFQLPHKKYLKKNKRNNFGNDKKKLKQVINDVYKTCQKRSSIPYTEYIIFYHTFIERLYNTAKQKNIKDLFFLAREGQYLKKVFDSYQEYTIIDETRKIKTHYLKMSRHAALQMSLKDIEVEPFTFLQLKYSNISADEFLIAVNCPDELRQQIISQLNVDGKSIVEGFFKSSIFENIKKNKNFLDYYNAHREASHNAFKAYVNSFDAQIEENGITVVDIGWGGTMQEAIFEFFDQKIPVTGYYLGLGNIYNIKPQTKRYGLISSLMPYLDYYDYILMANQQLYEQFSGANHGSAVDYSIEVKDYTIEYHKPEEKWLYDNHIKRHQEEMFNLHKLLLKRLEPICFSEEMMQNTISKIALKVGLFQSTKKLKFIDTLSSGFYQNVGHNKVGISYEPPKIKSPIKSMVRFLITPEKYFRYLVKLKPVLYKKNKVVAFFIPMYFIYLYFGFNKYLRFKILHRIFLLKYNAFK
ncbi:HAD family hydrolase [Winogradskyella luteola]|uniref:HAD family hydrolase n=1 Tax=Winogradskyella luteola TaxID=2828330 RepID=A0A9X1F819_9FLAO|nr:HAD family hydrolase [Winogradskyella luteola]MBV7269041.1 HAD family hydrolase [Winogradskyella luteola]